MNSLERLLQKLSAANAERSRSLQLQAEHWKAFETGFLSVAENVISPIFQSVAESLRRAGQTGIVEQQPSSIVLAYAPGHNPFERTAKGLPKMTYQLVGSDHERQGDISAYYNTRDFFTTHDYGDEHVNFGIFDATSITKRSSNRMLSAR